MLQLFSSATAEPALPGRWWRPLGEAAEGRFGGTYFAVGMTNSAPLPMLSGQRCMIDFCLV